MAAVKDAPKGTPVLTITISKLEPECISYSFNIDAKYGADRPELLEQLSLVRKLIEDYFVETEKAVLGKCMQDHRNIRRDILKQREEAETAAKVIAFPAAEEPEGDSN